MILNYSSISGIVSILILSFILFICVVFIYSPIFHLQPAVNHNFFANFGSVSLIIINQLIGNMSTTIASAEMEKIMVTLLQTVAIVLPIIIISIVYLLPSQAMAQYATGTPYPYAPGTTSPPYSNILPPSSYPYIPTPQQQQPLMPALPNSPSSPQYTLPSPSNPYQNPQQFLPPQSSSLVPAPSSPSSTNDTTVTNSTNTANSGAPSSSASLPTSPSASLPYPMQQQPQLQPPQLSQGTIMTGPQTSSLTVITRLNDTGGESMSPPLMPNTANNDNITASLPQVVTNAYANPDGYTVVYHFFRGSQSGVVLNLQPGIYSVSDQSSNNTNNSINSKTSSLLPPLLPLSLSFTHIYSGDCNNVRSIAGDIVGYGQINLGESKTCIITYDKNNKTTTNNIIK
jgi:hypothetical protein